jgi:hypothetical protein
MSALTGKVPGRIFMTYRREDTAYPAAWLFDRLTRHFGRDQVFKDIDSIELGDDFVEVITDAVGSCDALLALIGGRWLSITGRDGQRRLDDPGDFVRLEIEAALARDVRVIPILVEGAQMPRAEELPASMAKLARRQALELSPARFDADTQRLLRVLGRVITQAQEQARKDAEAAIERQRQVERLQQRIRDLAAGQDWDAVVAASNQLAALDPAAADPDALASMARGQIARRRRAEPPAATRQSADGPPARRGELPQADVTSPGPTPDGRVTAGSNVGRAPSRGVADDRAAFEASGGRPSSADGSPESDPGGEAPSTPGLRTADKAGARPDAPGGTRPHVTARQPTPWWSAAGRTTNTPHGPVAPMITDPVPTKVADRDIPAGPAVGKAASQPAGKPEGAGISDRVAEELGEPIADTGQSASGANVHTVSAARAALSSFGLYGAQLARHLRRHTVITLLAMLLAIVVGGGFVAWRWSQDQYYIGADNHGQVLIYRGVNERIVGVSLSHPYQQTGIRLAQVPAPYQQTVKATDTASNLHNAQAIVANVRSAVAACRQQYTALQDWVQQENAYGAALAQFIASHKPAEDKPKAPPARPAQPAAMCPPSTAFGIPASALVPAPSGSS